MKYWNLPKTTDISDMPLAAKVLAARGKSADFSSDCEISDPLLIADMQKAAEIIKTALINGDKIVIFGDYDCDGVTATVMLYRYLTAQGGEVDWLIPSRDEGYGLTAAAVDKLIDMTPELIITVDNGISAVEETRAIKEKGVKLIITDHHTVPEITPQADAIVNPKRPDDTSPCKNLAGCGVILKLIMAIEEDIDGVMEQFADLAAIGTIGDVVPLDGENRAIVKQGLEILPFTENIGLYKLLRQCGFLNEDDDENRLTANALSFTVCPRINAAGRFAHADKAAELLLSESEELAELRANELQTLNNTRRDTENEILEKADVYFGENPHLLSERVLILRGDDWHNGVIGIVSSRIMTKWGKPSIVIADDGVALRASARSVAGFPLVPMLEHCKPLLDKFGGHEKAAGFTAKSENLAELSAMIKTYCAEHFPVMPLDSLSIDKVVREADLSLENVAGLKILAPFGEENPVPLFLLQNCVIVSKKPLKDGKFLTFNVRLESSNFTQKVLCFNCGYSDFLYDINQAVDVIVTLDINEYLGTRSVSAQLKDIRPAGLVQERHFAALQAYESLVRGEKISSNLATRAFPDKADLKIIYGAIRESGGLTADKLFLKIADINYCKFKIALDVLAELKLISYNAAVGGVELLPVSGKVDVEDAAVLKRMKGLATL
ncbi:MAG: single-stranded-DNA-specific exonuclease RecJ [Oscillospiraceae bacterium]|nr:single-stranded-DNA-specific exonuclease RecJ [Oscillospiraceae bacterium]